MSFRFYDGHIYNQKNIWTDQFIEEHKDEIDWTKLLKKVKLTEEQIEKYENYIIWKNVFLYQPVSDQFIEKHIDKLDNFDWVCAHRNLSIEFASKYKDKIHWNFIVQNKLSKEFIIIFSDQINWSLFTLQHCYEWDEEFMREFKDKIDWQLLIDRKELSSNFKREIAFNLFKGSIKKQIMKYIGYNIKDEDWEEWSNNIDDKQGQLEITLHYNHKLTENTIFSNPYFFSLKYLNGRWNMTNKLKNFLTSHSELFDSRYAD